MLFALAQLASKFRAAFPSSSSWLLRFLFIARVARGSPKMKTDVENQLHIKRCSCGNLIVATVRSAQSSSGPQVPRSVILRVGLICGKCGRLPLLILLLLLLFLCLRVALALANNSI